MKINTSKYEALKAEKHRLSLILKAHQHMKGTPNHTAVAVKHKLVTKEISSLFKTGARHD